MTFDEYQEAAAKTAIYQRNENWGLTYAALGLASEAGEVAGKVKKLLRDNVFSREALKLELGDVTWYIAALCTEIGCSFDDVANANLDKLRDRKQRNALSGSGDNR